jgi:nicotinamidase-related amidase
MVTSLLTIDLQFDFFDSQSHPDSGRLAKTICLPGVKTLIEHARREKWRIIHAKTVHSGPETLPQHLRRRGVGTYCLANSLGSDLVPGLATATDIIIEKQSFDAFLGTELQTALKGSEEVVICGVAADCCVFLTANTAANVEQKRVLLPYQAIAASTAEDYIFGLRSVAKSFASVVDLRDLVRTKDSVLSLSGSGGMDYQTIETTSGGWFRAQLQRLHDLEKQADLNSLLLSEVLCLVEQKLAF